MKKSRFLICVYLLISMALLSSCNRAEKTSPVNKDIQEAIFASGYLEQENEYLISANVDGIIISLPFKEGDSANKNDLIAIVKSDIQDSQMEEALAVYRDAQKSASKSSPELQQIEAQIDQAKYQLALDRDNYLRYKDLLDKNSVSQLDFEMAELQYKASQNNLIGLEKNYQEATDALNLNEERSRAQLKNQRSLLEDYQLRATQSGQIINVFKKEGELLRRGETIAKIASGKYIIKLFVAEEDIVKVDLGQYVAVNINTYPNNSFRARITKIYPGFDEIEQSYIVEAQFEQLPEKLFSGTQLQANIETINRKDVLVVPTDYVSRDNSILLENGEEIQIVTGSRNNNWTEVISGISETDVIVKPMD